MNFSGNLLFADDFKIFKLIKSNYDCELLQHDINSVTKWCENNCLHLNISKCKLISFTRSPRALQYSYNINGTELERVDKIKDLGVYFDNKMSFNDHYNYIVSKGNKLLGFLKRNSRDFKDPHTLKSLYISLVRSNLEYACCIWNPTYVVSINRIEAVQRKFTRYALRKLNWIDDVMPSYEQRCLLLGLQTLESRRKQYLVMLARDVLCSKIDCSALLALYPIFAPSRPLRERKMFFYVPRFYTNYGKNDPVSSSCILFNSVCDIIDLHLSRFLFKKALMLVIW